MIVLTQLFVRLSCKEMFFTRIHPSGPKLVRYFTQMDDSVLVIACYEIALKYSAIQDRYVTFFHAN